LFSAINYTGSNPVADGYLSFSSDGAGNTRVQFDSDALGSRGKALVATLDGVSPGDLTMQVDWYFKDGSAAVNAPPPNDPPPNDPPPPPPPPPSGSSGLFTLPTSGAGIETVSTTAANYTLPAGTENVILAGGAPQNVTANDLNNIITSNNYGS